MYTGREESSGSMEKTIQLKIEGMHCAGCVRRVTQALSALEGVKIESVAVGSAAVALDAAHVSPEQVEAAVTGIGFPAHAER
jgi:copper chaperone